MFIVQKLLSECQSHRDCQMPVNHLLFGKDPCPGTTKYLHVDYKCKPSEFIGSNFVSAQVSSHILKRIATQPHIKILPTPNSSRQFPTTIRPSSKSSLLLFSPLTQLNTKDMWCVKEKPWSCAVSPPGR